MSFEKDYNLYPNVEKRPEWEEYCKELWVEVRQSIEEGLDIGKYKDLIYAVHALENDQHKAELAEVIWNIVKTAEIKEGYKYNEPSDLEGIKALRKPYEFKSEYPKDKEALREKISGAWYGRICGCLLGKPVEGMKYNELKPFLEETGNAPMHRYIMNTDVTDEVAAKYKFKLKGRCYPDNIDCAPWDDDTNYTVLAQILINQYGRDFTPYDVSRLWLARQPKDSYCTAERIAIRNFIEGYLPPVSAVYKNPYREWIGAQIRGDYFGYINPGNPELAAEMAWRDASISHIKNGIYGEMFASAMIACAAVTDNIKDIIYGGLAQIPATSRLYEQVVRLINRFDEGVTQEECFADIHAVWNDMSGHDWCHTISNALIVVAALLYGNGDYGKSICMAVETGFDTDCNGATVGSIIGMRNGENGIDEYWKAPTHGILDTTIFGASKSEISKMVDNTMPHIPEVK